MKLVLAVHRLIGRTQEGADFNGRRQAVRRKWISSGRGNCITRSKARSKLPNYNVAVRCLAGESQDELA